MKGNVTKRIEGGSNRNMFANALRGQLFGASVSADDVSPMEHELDVKVKSKNIFPNSYTNKGTVTSNSGGIKITYNSDGSIVCNGTVSGSRLFHSAIALDGSVVTEREAVFSTNTSGNAPSGTKIQIEVIRPDGVTALTGNGTKLQKGTSITRVYIACNAGAVYDNFVFKPQLEYGTVPTEFVSPSFNTDGTKVKLYGKNLIPFPYVDGVSKKVNGVTFKVNTDRSVDYSGTATADSYFTLCQGVDFGESFGTPSTGEDSTNGTYVINRGLLYNADDLTLSIMVPKGTNVGRRIYPQIGLGTSPSEYEPYVEPIEYTVINGEIKGLKPISKGMTLFTDNADTVIDCTYNRDANKVIENLTNAIISLGGNI